MEKIVDLHVHTTASDGTYAPSEIISKAAALNISAVAVTDHDSTDGIDEALSAGEEYDVEVIPGVELSTEYEDNEIHVLGLYVDKTSPALIESLSGFKDGRDNRNIKMIDRLREEGFEISAEEIYARNPNAVIARPHMARYLVDTGQIKDIQTVFNEYIGEGCKCYVERFKITPIQAVKIIHESKGIAILAHPCVYEIEQDLKDRMINEIASAGLDGIEALYPLNKAGDEEHYRHMAKKLGLVISGGSDFHGSNKPDIFLGSGNGSLKVPYKILEDIRSYRQSTRTFL